VSSDFYKNPNIIIQFQMLMILGVQNILMKMMGKPFLVGGIFQLAELTLQLVTPIFLSLIITFMKVKIEFFGYSVFLNVSSAGR